MYINSHIDSWLIIIFRIAMQRQLRYCNLKTAPSCRCYPISNWIQAIQFCLQIWHSWLIISSCLWNIDWYWYLLFSCPWVCFGSRHVHSWYFLMQVNCFVIHAMRELWRDWHTLIYTSKLFTELVKKNPSLMLKNISVFGIRGVIPKF